jgi:hypothetical protein
MSRQPLRFGKTAGARVSQDVVDFRLQRTTVGLGRSLELLQDVIVQIAEKNIWHRDEHLS